METSREDAILDGPERHVYDCVEEIGAACPALERLGDDVLMIGQVGAAVAARVYSRPRQEGAVHAAHLQRSQKSLQLSKRKVAEFRARGSAEMRDRPHWPDPSSPQIVAGGRSKRVSGHPRAREPRHAPAAEFVAELAGESCSRLQVARPHFQGARSYRTRPHRQRGPVPCSQRPVVRQRTPTFLLAVRSPRCVTLGFPRAKSTARPTRRHGHFSQEKRKKEKKSYCIITSILLHRVDLRVPDPFQRVLCFHDGW